VTVANKSKNDVVPSQCKEGDYTPFKHLPRPPKGYETRVLRAYDRQLQAADMLSEAGVLTSISPEIDMASKFAAARNNIVEHTSHAYPELAPPQKTSRVYVATVAVIPPHTADVDRPALIPVSDAMTKRELRRHTAMHHHAVMDARNAAQSVIKRGDAPLVANVYDHTHEGHLKSVLQKFSGKRL
jgi:hypothetical protein